MTTSEETTPAPGSGLGAGEGLRYSTYEDRLIWNRQNGCVNAPATAAETASMEKHFKQTQPVAYSVFSAMRERAEKAEAAVVALAQSRPEPDTAQGWRAIGEAPKDETLVLGGRWAPHGEGWRMSVVKAPLAYPFTHFMPLPAPPAAEATS